MGKKVSKGDFMRRITENMRKKQNAQKSRTYNETKKLPKRNQHILPKISEELAEKVKPKPEPTKKPVDVPSSTGTGRGRKGLPKPEWTAYEEKLLEDMAGEKSDEEMTQLLRDATSKPFTRSAVRKKRQRMGLKKCMGRGKVHLYEEDRDH